MKMKKLMSLLLACVMVLAMLAGCSDKPSGEASKAPENPSTESKAPEEGDKTPEGDGKSITMWSMWSSGEPQANVIQEAAAAYEAKTGVKVNIEFKGRDVNKVLTASLEAKEDIDIIEDDYKRIGTVYNKFTMDLTDMAKAANYDSFSYKCFTDQSIAWAGYLNAITEQPNIGGIFYDKDAFEAAGVTAEPKTWAEFLDVCQKLKDAGIAPMAQDSAYCDFAFYHTLVRYLGETKIEELTMNGGWSGTAAEKAAQDVIDMVNAGYFVDGAPDEHPSSQNKIGFGQAAMVICADYVTAEVNNNTQTEVNWGLFNYPAVDGGADNGAAYMGANSLAIPSYSENAQEAFDFIIFLTTGEWGQKLADEAHQIPADSRNTAPSDLTGTIETLQAAESPMTWCAAISANADLKDTIKSLCVELFEGKYADGAAFCAALDALY
ncbi:MAG: extracellular solute-binding protein [Oscillospiraceae bacterium]|nr:extracellular solute-binding protein [Oscillospiraceae bacterium]